MSALERLDQPVLWLDLDGVFSDFRRAVREQFGVAQDEDMRAAWDRIAANPAFWRGLPLLPDAHELWAGVRHLGPRILSGGCLSAVTGDPQAAPSLRPCAAAKEDWVARHLGRIPIVVTEARAKAEFCRPGDILIDDKAANIEAWRRAGGIGILHERAARTLQALSELGLDRGWDAAPYQALAARLRAGTSRTGRVHWVLEAGARRQLVDAFEPALGADGRRLRARCHHVLGAPAPVAAPPPTGFSEIRVVGEVVAPERGLHLLAVEVDGELRRPGGGIHHLVFAAGPAPDCPDELLDALLVAEGEGALRNLPGDQALRLTARWRFGDRLRETRPPRPCRVPIETEEPWVFPSGRLGRRKVVVRRDFETVVFVDERGGKHNEDGPAIVTRFLPTGEVRFADWWRDGERQQSGAQAEADMVRSTEGSPSAPGRR